MKVQVNINSLTGLYLANKLRELSMDIEWSNGHGLRQEIVSIPGSY